MKVILEGGDLTGKTTAIQLINGMFPVQDRHMEITNAITPESIDYAKIVSVIQDNPDDLFVFLFLFDDVVLKRRLELRENPDEYDLKCYQYNAQYKKVVDHLMRLGNKNFRWFYVDGMTKFEKTAKIFELYLEHANPNVAPRSV